LLDKEALKPERTSNFTAEFLQAIKSALGTEPTPEEIFITSTLFFTRLLTGSVMKSF